MSANQTHRRGLSNVTTDSADQSRLDRYGFFAEESLETDDLNIEKLQSREKKWLAMFKNWDYWMTEKFPKVRDRCRKGIPPSVRAQAWLKLSGAEVKIKEGPGAYQNYVESEADPKCIADIVRDVGRQFPEHIMFHTNNPEETHMKLSQLENSPDKLSSGNGPLSNDQDGSKGHIGQNELFRLLKAYCVHNRRDGYCQAQAPIAAALIMQMPEEEQAFWVMERIFDVYLTGYYKVGLEQMQIDGEILMELLKSDHPKIFKLLSNQHIDPPLFMIDWFMCCFIRSLPWPSVLRVMDMFLCEGIKVLFRVGLAIISNTLNAKVLKSCTSQFETLPLIKRPPKTILVADFLVKESLKTNLTERDIAAAHLKVLRRWKENNRLRDQQKHQLQSQQMRNSRNSQNAKTPVSPSAFAMREHQV